jgi:hypothetical protein
LQILKLNIKSGKNIKSINLREWAKALLLYKFKKKSDFTKKISKKKNFAIITYVLQNFSDFSMGNVNSIIFVFFMTEFNMIR